MITTDRNPDGPRQRQATARGYLMCPPEHFAVTYAINPWMEPDKPTDAAKAMRQWSELRQAYLDLGHEVRTIEPVAGLPDMVFAANGATVIGGTVLGARFLYPQRAREADAYLDWFRDHGFADVRVPDHVNEGEGDILFTGRTVLAGYGFRSDGAAAAELGQVFGRPVVSLRLVDPRFYHLDTALCVLDPDTAMYYPAAFDDAGRAAIAAAVRRTDRGEGRGRRGTRPERGQRRPARRPAGPSARPGRSTPRPRVRTRRGRPVRTAQGRRRAQVLHSRATVLNLGPAPRKGHHDRNDDQLPGLDQRIRRA